MLSMIVITANFWGFLTGEWTNAGRKARQYLLSGVAVLTLAICIVGYANYK